MRKICFTAVVVLLLGCLVSMSSFADGNMLRVRAAGQFGGNQSFTAVTTANYAVSTGFSMGAEGLIGITRNFQLGAGLEYQLGRTITSSGVTGTFEFLPIYGVVRVPFDIGSVQPYLVGRIGYGLWSGDAAYAGGISLNGGLFYAGGGGVDFRFGNLAIFGEAAYSVNNGSYTSLGVNVDTSYTRLDISAGLSISL